MSTSVVRDYHEKRLRARADERIMAALTPGRGYGWSGGLMQGDRVTQVMQMQNWFAVGTDIIAKLGAQIIPNIAYVRPQARPGKTQKWFTHNYEHMRDLTFGGQSIVSGSYRRKALSVIKPHEELEPVEANHPLRKLQEDPNPWDTQFDHDYELIMYQYLNGVAYDWAAPSGFRNDRGESIPRGLWCMPTPWVWPRTGGGELVNPNNPYADHIISYYEIRPFGVGSAGAGVIRLPPDQIIRYAFKSPINKIDGLAKTWTGRNWLDADNSIAKSQYAQMSNIARPSLFLKLGEGYEDPSDDQIERILAKFRQRNQGELNMGNPFVGPPGMEPVPLDFPPLQMAYGEAMDQSRDRILALLNVPKSAVGLSDAMTFGSILATLMQLCLDEETECLTAEGWVKHDNLTTATRIACYDPDSDSIVYRQPSRITGCNYQGPMHKWKSQEIDLLVTPAHRMYVQTFEKPGDARRAWSIRRIDDLAPTTVYRLKQAAKAACDEPCPINVDLYARAGKKYRDVCGTLSVDPEIWLGFLGYFLSEGCLLTREKTRKGYYISIVQRHDSPCAPNIDRILAAMPWKWKRELKSTGCYVWNVSDKGLYEHLERNCGRGCANKKIPDYVKAWPADSLRILLDALIDGDGTKPTIKNNIWHSSYFTVSPRLADDVHELGTKCGLRSALRKGVKTRNHQGWRVDFSSRTESTIAGPKRSVVDYSGKVWCVEVPTGLFFVRRNGMVHVTGNCSFAINPLLAANGQTRTKFLASKFSTRENPIKIWYDDCTPPDPDQLNKDIDTDAKWGAITPNEIRAIRSRQPYKHGGDDPLVAGPGGMIPLPLNTGDDLSGMADLVPLMGRQDNPAAEEEEADNGTGPKVEEPNGAPSKQNRIKRWTGPRSALPILNGCHK